MKDNVNELDFPELDQDEFERADLSIMNSVYNISAQQEFKKPPGVPHCDCKGANIAAGITSQAVFDRSNGLQMRRTQADVKGGCVYCGCHVFLRPIDKVNKNRGMTHGPRVVKQLAKPGVVSEWHIKDGEINTIKLKNDFKTPNNSLPKLIIGVLK